MMVCLGVVVVPAVADAINGVLKPTDGCRIWNVVDGDTVRMYCPASGFLTGRIIGIDTPEKRARCASEFFKSIAAEQYLRWQLLRAGSIHAKTEGRDRYGRALTLLLLDGQGVARPMVNAGLARWYDGGPRASWCEKKGMNVHV